jgi:lipopolysaccharide transport system permease protein
MPQIDSSFAESLAVEECVHRLPEIIRIAPSVGWSPVDLAEVWRYRELIYFFIWRDIKVRYKQTALGVAWAVIQPLTSMVVFSLFFGRLAKIPSDGVPYPLFNLVALVPWNFFANGLSQIANSLVESANLIKKVYFPRLVVPLGALLSGSVDFALTFVLVVSMMFYYGVRLGPHAIFFVPFLLLSMVTCLGAGLWLAALNVQYRDVRYVIPFLVQLWLFATPIVYPSSLLAQPWRTIYGLNPMVGVIEGSRWALLGTSTAPGPIVAVSSLASVALLVSGAFYFRRMERSFADIV